MLCFLQKMLLDFLFIQCYLCESVKLLERALSLTSIVVPQGSHQTHGFTQVKFHSQQRKTCFIKAQEDTMAKCAHKRPFKFVQFLSSVLVSEILNSVI